jgi:hypothetical protein
MSGAESNARFTTEFTESTKKTEDGEESIS